MPDDAITRMAQELARQLLYVAIDSDELLGFVSIQDKSNQAAEISWIAVKPSRQGQGIGSELIDRISHDLLSRGINLLEVKTLAKDADYPPYKITHRFYEKIGFVHLEQNAGQHVWGGRHGHRYR